MHQPAVMLQLPCHCHPSLSQRSVSPAAPRGERGRHSKTEPGRGRREGSTEGEGGGTAVRALFIEGCFFLCWKLPPAVPWPGRDGGIHPSSSQGSKRQRTLGMVLRSLQTP